MTPTWDTIARNERARMASRRAQLLAMYPDEPRYTRVLPGDIAQLADGKRYIVVDADRYWTGEVAVFFLGRRTWRDAAMHLRLSEITSVERGAAINELVATEA